VLATDGRVLAVNDLFEAMPTTFLPLAHGGVAIADAPANTLFERALEGLRGHEPTVQSIPVSAQEGRPAFVIHILPLRRSAHEIFSGAEILVAATVPSPSAMVPSPQVLHGLFDLTPAETRLAMALACGLSLRQAAASNGNRFSTARSQLETVFRKTGTNKQGQLVALLKSAAPLTRR
jgi:DNA-binding CsgD family transcriptional regulator